MYIANETRYTQMKYNRCGASGLKLPVVSLGLWHNFGSNGNFDNMLDLCQTAFDRGITHFDLANIEKDGLKAYAAENGIGIITFCPLAQGLLTDRYMNGIPENSRIKTDGRFLKEDAITDETLGKVRALNAIAKERGQSLAQMALAWIMRDGDITSVLIGASRAAQIMDNVGMLENTRFESGELEQIELILNS